WIDVCSPHNLSVTVNQFLDLQMMIAKILVQLGDADLFDENLEDVVVKLKEAITKANTTAKKYAYHFWANEKMSITSFNKVSKKENHMH
ncbi:hypothetical protein ACJX0J_018296, partial [Zea mays]